MDYHKFMAVTVSQFKHTSVFRVSHFIHLTCVAHPSYTLILKILKKVIKVNRVSPALKVFGVSLLVIYCINKCVTNCRVLCVSANVECHSFMVSNKSCVTK